MTDHQLSKLYKEYRDRLMTVARLYVRENAVAEDIVADSFVQLHSHIADIPSDMNIGAYLMTIVKNKCLNYLKQKETRSRIEAEMLRSLQTLEPSQIFSCELQRLVAQTVGLMPELTRRIFIESRYNEKTYQEIADELGLSHRRVHTEMQRALSLLRTALQDYLPAAILILYLENLVK